LWWTKEPEGIYKDREIEKVVEKEKLIEVEKIVNVLARR